MYGEFRLVTVVVIDEDDIGVHYLSDKESFRSATAGRRRQTHDKAVRSSGVLGEAHESPFMVAWLSVRASRGLYAMLSRRSIWATQAPRDLAGQHGGERRGITVAWAWKGDGLLVARGCSAVQCRARQGRAEQGRAGQGR